MVYIYIWKLSINADQKSLHFECMKKKIWKYLKSLTQKMAKCKVVPILCCCRWRSCYFCCCSYLGRAPRSNPYRFIYININSSATLYMGCSTTKTRSKYKNNSINNNNNNKNHFPFEYHKNFSSVCDGIFLLRKMQNSFNSDEECLGCQSISFTGQFQYYIYIFIAVPMVWNA